MTILLFNRDPEPGEADVPTNVTIALDLADDESGDIDVSETKVWIGGVLAFDGGTHQTGFEGPESTYSEPQPGALRILIDPDDPLDGNANVTVRVASQLEGAPTENIDETYAFTTEDLAGPTIDAALAIGMKVLQVDLDDDVVAVSASADNDALNPASWAIDLVTGDDQTRLPAVTVEIASVEAITVRRFELTTDIDMSPDATYDVTAVEVVDDGGNFALSPGNVARFIGYRPPQPAGRDFDITQFVPRVALDDDVTGDLAKTLGIIQEVAEVLLYEIDRFPELLDPDTAPSAMVDLMLADIGYPFDFDLTLTDKRRLIKVLRRMYRQKGTDRGVINAIRFFMGIEVSIFVPYLTGGYLGRATLGGTFVLSTSDTTSIYTMVVNVPQTLTATEEAQMDKLVDFMKRQVCHHRIEAPSAPPTIDHWALGRSRLGTQTILH